MVGAIESQPTYLDPDSWIACTAVLLGGALAGAGAVKRVRLLDRLWGIRGSQEKARRFLEVFSLRILSSWLRPQDEGRSDQERAMARQLWGQVVLALFESLSEDRVNQFVGRDRQYQYDHYQYERTLQQAGGEDNQDSAAVPLRDWLLLSDACVALGGEPLIAPAPVTGYPYQGIDDIMARGGVRRALHDDEVRSLSLLVAVGSGMCGEYHHLGSVLARELGRSWRFAEWVEQGRRALRSFVLESAGG